MAEDGEAEQQWPSNFCGVPLKFRKTCPGMEIRIAVYKNIKRDIVLLLCFGSATRITATSQLSIRINEKYTNKQKHHDYLDGN